MMTQEEAIKQALAKASQDGEFKAALLADPQNVLSREFPSISFSSNIQLDVELSDEDLDSVSGGWGDTGSGEGEGGDTGGEGGDTGSEGGGDSATGGCHHGTGTGATGNGQGRGQGQANGQANGNAWGTYTAVN